MEDSVAYLVRELRIRFPTAGITEMLTATNSLLTCPALSMNGMGPCECLPESSMNHPATSTNGANPNPSHFQQPQRQPSFVSPLLSPRSMSATGSSFTVGSPAVSPAWQSHVTAVLDMAAGLQPVPVAPANATAGAGVRAPTVRNSPRAGVVALVEGAVAAWWQWQQQQQGNGAGDDADPYIVNSGGVQRQASSSGQPICTSRQNSVAAASGTALLPSDEAGRPRGTSSRGSSVPLHVLGARHSNEAGGISVEAGSSVISIDATPEELPVGITTVSSASGLDIFVPHGPMSTTAYTMATEGSDGSPLTAASANDGGADAAAALATGRQVATYTPPAVFQQAEGGEQLTGSVESTARLAENLCRGVYQDLYEQLVLATRDADEEPDTGAAGQGTSQPPSTSTPANDEELPAPLCSLVLECGRAVPVSATCGRAGAVVNGGTITAAAAAMQDETLCFVIGCSWEQWEYLQRGPLACRCEPFPSDSGAVAQQRWRQRHCSLRLLHPVLDFFQQRNIGSPNGLTKGGDVGTDGAEDGTASTDNTTTVEYELGDEMIVLRSLLGLAMRVWGESDVHLIAQILDLEDTTPHQTFHSDAFWPNFPHNIPPPARRGDRASLRDCHLPIPLLPGEYVDADDGSSSGAS